MSSDDEKDPAEILRRFEATVSGMELDDLKSLASQLLAVEDPEAASTAPPPQGSLRRQRRRSPSVFTVRVDLEEASPPIWRRLEVRSDIGLDTFHQVLQAAFGWTDSHLHRFAVGGSPFDRQAELFLCPFDVQEGEDEGVPAADVTLDETLGEPGDILRYAYDYGDSWDLTIALESVRPLADADPVAVCVDGRRAAPPEDCGGIRTAAELAEVVDDPDYLDLGEVNQQLLDPFVGLREQGVRSRLVDLLNRLRGSEIGDQLVVQAMGLVQPRDARSSEQERAAALQPHLWFLDRVGVEGLSLTQAGYLRPDDVAATAAVLPTMADWIGAANRESHSRPVLHFRESLQALGLLRKHKGRLLLTKAGAAVRADPAALWRHLVDRLPPGRDRSVEVPAGLLLLLWVGSTPDAQVSFDGVAAALTRLGWREEGREVITAAAARWAAVDTLTLLETMSVDSGRDRFSWRRRLTPVVGDLAREALSRRGEAAAAG